VKAKKYKIKVCDSALDFSHGFSREVEEICIPELRLFVNLEACFVLSEEETKRRVPKKFEAIEVDSKLADFLAKTKEAEKKFRDHYFKKDRDD
jgi:hypothetical protein